MININYVLLIFIILPFTSNTSTSHNGTIEILQEAEDYLKIKSSHSLKLLEQIKNLPQQSDKVIIRWHIIRARASVATNDLSIIEESIKRILTFQEHPYFIQRLPTILWTIGIYLRKSGYFNQADASFSCALQFTDNDRLRLFITNSQGLSARHSGQYARAKKLYMEAIQLAKKLRFERMIANIENNLGSVAVDSGQFVQAEQHYRKAYAGFQKSGRRSSHITAGINLLFVFLLQKQELNYQRLYSPIAALTETSPDKSKHAFLFWINWAFKAKMGEKIDDKTREQLQDSFIKLESRKLQYLIKKHLAQRLSISLTLAAETALKPIDLPWLPDILKCKWKPKN
ncbi:tetratricopeptide repeat protein [Pseudoalteromonas denitrificans]|uniref:Tetratricopeptide repeat-containing protein n=1 Tax=Pseudoalteromonas denitrificans DSM 6059 TaxID=1123010 RepID=A0A1I1PT57_9GAMM|nr:tetratricopeptide repeat protein [Pseudoalteromonas denitrificans]SFD12832.1 Tetratricopeptide repeat-containing protein [Pseudoalteromonas denitrificans DSM 6059]